MSSDKAYGIQVRKPGTRTWGFLAASGEIVKAADAKPFEYLPTAEACAQDLGRAHPGCSFRVQPVPYPAAWR